MKKKNRDLLDSGGRAAAEEGGGGALSFGPGLRKLCFWEGKGTRHLRGKRKKKKSLISCPAKRTKETPLSEGKKQQKRQTTEKGENLP